MPVLGVFEKALNYFRSSAPDLKEERAMLLEKWLNMETTFGDLGDVSLVQSKLPKKLKKRRHVTTEDGSTRYVTNSVYVNFYTYEIFLLLYFCKSSFFLTSFLLI